MRPIYFTKILLDEWWREWGGECKSALGETTGTLKETNNRRNINYYYLKEVKVIKRMEIFSSIVLIIKL